MKSITKNVVTYFFFLIAISAFLSCSDDKGAQNIKNKTTDNSGIRKRIQEITSELNRAVLANDYETQLKYFTDDAAIVPPLGPKVEGKTAIKKAYERNIEEKLVIHSFNATIEDLWQCGDRVYEKGTWAMSQSSKRSKIPKAYHGSYFEIWKVQKDSTILIDYMIYTLGFNPFGEK